MSGTIQSNTYFPVAFDNAMAIICFLLRTFPLAPRALPDFLLSRYSSRIFELIAFCDDPFLSGIVRLLNVVGMGLC